jgi:CRP-like cAMP-binding protein/thioredoxin reductase/Pyruvate/2-oxoacid:ferredoxin oxidoreductase delta subunit
MTMDFSERIEFQRYRIAIVGSGPAGLSAAAHAAELGIPHVLLEAEDHLSNTIHKYQKGKHVMAEPQVLPLRSPLSFGAGKREAILEAWNAEVGAKRVNVRHGCEVSAIEGADGGFSVRTRSAEVFVCEKVILAIGLQGNLRTLGVPGEDLDGVQYQLDDPEEYEGETIVVVGAGDAAIENALALAERNTVILLNRNEEFARCKEGNLSLVLAAIKEGRIECRYGTAPTRVETGQQGLPLDLAVRSAAGAESIPCHRVIARLGAIPPRKLVEGFGVKFPSADPTAVPELSETYESNVKGLYIVGALGGYPLIKQAMNQGYEVVEFALGRAVAPADEPLLERKFAAFGKGARVPEVVEMIRARVPLLAEVNKLQLREFLLESEVRAPRHGETIFERNDYTNSFFMVVSGEVKVELLDEDGKRKGWLPLGEGEFFGELGLISGRRRSNSVMAREGCVLIEAPRRAMLKLIAQVESVRKRIDEAFLKRAVRAYLAPMLPEAELDALIATGVQTRRYAGGEALFREGDAPDGLYLIRRGSVMIVRTIAGREVVLSYLSAGNYVGEMALLSESPRTATVKAAVTTEALVLDSQSFKEVLGRNPAWREDMEERFLDRLRANAAMESQQDPGNIIAFLMKQGLGEATDVLLIDESLCVRCDNCEKACADVHDGTSRLDREAGPTFAQIHVPTSCRHCEHPHCMKECPPDAIHRTAEGEVFINDTCIGCGNCERNCPYGVIQLAPVDPKRERPSLISWLFFGAGSEPGLEPKAKGKDIPKKAVKCDMCKDLAGGAACVRACPTGAAIRVSPEQFLDYAGPPE